MRIKVKHYLDEYINGKWHTVDVATEEDVDIHEIRLEHIYRKPTSKFRIRKVEIR